MTIIDINTINTSDHLPSEKIESFSKAVLSYLKISNCEISILFCSDRYIETLNKSYLGIDSPTDVLSFPQHVNECNSHEKGFHAGDIVISPEAVKRNADAFSVPLEEEISRVIIHGILHLLGMDHSDFHRYDSDYGGTNVRNDQEYLSEMQQDTMIRLQETILEYIGGIDTF